MRCDLLCPPCSRLPCDNLFASTFDSVLIRVTVGSATEPLRAHALSRPLAIGRGNSSTGSLLRSHGTGDRNAVGEYEYGYDIEYVYEYESVFGNDMNNARISESRACGWRWWWWIRTYKHTLTYIHRHTCTYVHTCVYKYTRLHTCTHIHACTYAHINKYIRIRMYHTHIRTLIHTTHESWDVGVHWQI